MAAVGIRTSDAGNAPAVVAAGEKASGDGGDPLEAEVAQFLGVALVVLLREGWELISEEPLEGVGAALGVDRLR